MLGAPDVGTFHNDRARLIDSVGREAQRVVDTYDQQPRGGGDRRSGARRGGGRGRGGRRRGRPRHARHDRRIDRRRRRHRHPARERRARRRLPDHPGAPATGEGDAQEKVAALRARLHGALGTEFERAREQSGHRLDDAVAPYARFVRAEERRWREAQQALSGLAERATATIATIGAVETRR